MLAKARRLGGLKWAIKVRKAELKFAKVIKVWRAGSELEGFKQAAVTFGKGMGKDTLGDVMNGGWSEAKNNFLANLSGNAIGAGTGPLLDKGFAKIPRLINSGDLSAMSSSARRSIGSQAMTMNGQTEKSKLVLSTAKGFVTSVTKETVTSTVFGQDFDLQRVAIGSLTGIGDSGISYQPGLFAAAPYRR